MGRISWKLYRTSYPFMCSNCKAGLWEVREICENCGEKLTIRKTTRKDYKAEMKRKRG